MKTKALAFGKAAQKKTKFKSAKENELSASDKTFIRNNIEKFPVSALANRIGKSVELIEKFLKQENLIADDTKTTSINSVQIEEKTEIESNVKLIPENEDENVNNKRDTKINKPTNAELEERRKFFLENHKKMRIKEMAEMINVSRFSVMHDLKVLGLVAHKPKEDSPKVVEYVKQNYRTSTNQDMADALGLPTNIIRNICARYKLVRTVEETQAIRHNWRRASVTDEQLKFIKENFGILKTSEIMEKLSISKQLYYRTLQEIGLSNAKKAD